jgi:hypothetical protein
MFLIARQLINDAASIVTNAGGAVLNGQYKNLFSIPPETK